VKEFIYDGTPIEPEVASVKLWLRDWIMQDKTINMHIDLHSQSQQGEDNVIYMPKDGMLKDFCNKLNSYFQMRYIAMEFNGSATYAMDTEFYLPTTVFEITQSGISDVHYLTIDDYKSNGEGIVKAFHDYVQAGGNGNLETKYIDNDSTKILGTEPMHIFMHRNLWTKYSYRSGQS
jgi:hypothetical protein